MDSVACICFPCRTKRTSSKAGQTSSKAEQTSRGEWSKHKDMRFLARPTMFASPGLRIVSWPETPKIDIVFVHGAGGTHETDWMVDGTFWPRDLLQKDLKGARIACWEYKKENVAIFNVIAGTAMEFAEEMCNALFNVGGYGLRPLIFVAHDLGGLIVLKSLELYTYHRGEVRGSVRNTRAVLFFGLPTSVQKQALMLDACSNRNSTLGEPWSEMRPGSLGALQSSFWNLAAGSSIKLAYCKPTLPCSRACGSKLQLDPNCVR